MLSFAVKGIAVGFFFLMEILYWVNNDRISLKTNRQVFKLLLFCLLFYLSALASPVTDKTDIFWVATEGLLLVPLFLFIANKLYRDSVLRRGRGRKEVVSTADKAIVGAIVFISVASRVWLVNTIQKWDCSEYYYALTKAAYSFNFHPVESFLTFRLLRHPVQGFCFWEAIGAFLWPDKVYAILGVSLALTCAGSVCLYGLFRSYWTKMSRGSAFVGVLLCLALPLFWAGASCVMPDYNLLLYILFMMNADRKKENVMVFFWGAMAAFCKEIGMLLVATYFAAKVLALLFRYKGGFMTRVWKVFKNGSVWAGIFVGVAIIGYMLLTRNVDTWSHSVYYSSPLSWSGSSETIYNTFGIQSDNIITRLLQYFVVNFMWIVTGLLLVALVVLPFKRKKTGVNIQAVAELVGVLATYAVFMCLYITAGELRYNVAYTVLYTALVYSVVVSVFPKLLAYIAGVGLTGVMVIQSFSSVDPVTRHFFKTVDVGNADVLCVAQSTNLSPGGDYYITNLQYRSISENFEKMFTAIELQPEDVILVAGKNYAECNKNLRISELNGRHSDIVWDRVQGRYVNKYDKNANCVKIKQISTNKLWGFTEFPGKDALNSKKDITAILENVTGNIYVYFSPLLQSDDEDEIIDQLSRVFEIGKIKRVQTNGNVLRYSKLAPKPSKDWKLQTTAKVDNAPIEIDDEVVYNVDAYNDIRENATRGDEEKRTDVRLGDEVSVLISCYDENGKYINMGIQPKGTVNHTLSVGSGDYLGNVDLELIGKSVGETVHVSCEVPEDYANYPNLAGKTMQMDISIAGITGQNDESFTVCYHRDDEAERSYLTTVVKYGVSTQTLTYGQLGFSGSGRRFIGWKAFNTENDSWLMCDENGNGVWEDSLSEKRDYYLMSNGAEISVIVEPGYELHLYAQWEDTEDIYVYYHKSGVQQKPTSNFTVSKEDSEIWLKTPEQLGFSRKGKKFVGWKALRTDSFTWRVMDAAGNAVWASALRDDYSYALYDRREILMEDFVAGTELHLYAQWEDADTFTVYYHDKNFGPASETVTEVNYGNPTKTISYQELGFQSEGKRFAGWRAFRTDSQCWRFYDADGTKVWAEKIPEGGAYCLYDDAFQVKRDVYAGSELHLYAQWDNAFTVHYHKTDFDEAIVVTTKVEYGVETAVLTCDKLGFVVAGKRFVGWKVYREDTKTWQMLNAKGQAVWSKNVPEGGGYALYADAAVLSREAEPGVNLHLYGQWEDTDEYTVCYHLKDGAQAVMSVAIKAGEPFDILDAEELEESGPAKRFLGWKVYRSDIQCWSYVDSLGTITWANKRSKDSDYCLYRAGEDIDWSLPEELEFFSAEDEKSTEGSVFIDLETETAEDDVSDNLDEAAWSVPAGSEVHLYAQWSDTYSIHYHLTDFSEASDVSTRARYTVPRRIVAYDRLGFFLKGKKFSGWKVFCPDSKRWRLKDEQGNEIWDANVREGWSYFLCSDVCELDLTCEVGSEVHLFAQWEDTDQYSVYYHYDDGAEASKTVTRATCDESTKLLSTRKLGFKNGDLSFIGWKCYDASRQLWRVTDAGGKIKWAKSLQPGERYALYKNGAKLREDYDAGTIVHLYAQWSDSFTVYYHKRDSAKNSAITTAVHGSTPTRIESIESLGFKVSGKRFIGWKAYRTDMKCWRVSNGAEEAWVEAVNSDSEYFLFEDEAILQATLPPGVELHLYAQWE